MNNSGQVPRHCSQADTRALRCRGRGTDPVLRQDSFRLPRGTPGFDRLHHSRQIEELWSEASCLFHLRQALLHHRRRRAGASPFAARSVLLGHVPSQHREVGTGTLPFPTLGRPRPQGAGRGVHLLVVRVAVDSLGIAQQLSRSCRSVPSNTNTFVRRTSCGRFLKAFSAARASRDYFRAFVLFFSQLDERHWPARPTQLSTG